jgi:tetratricopeptide (TPR) repeat protein
MTPNLDLPTWYGARGNELKAVGAFQQGPTFSYQQQHAFIHAEIETWSKMTDQDHQATNEYLISRRTALATLSTSLLAKIQFGPFTSIVIEEFLAESTTSIVACWHLLRGDGLTTVEHALPKYLPLLLALIKQYTLYKTKASYLASQGFLLLSLVALHRLHFSKRVAYCKQAVELARESGDRTLLVPSLMHLGDAFFTNGQRDEMLHTYYQAEYQSKSPEISMFLRSKVLAELVHAYAQQGRDQEALRSVGEARTLFTEETYDTPVFLSTDYDHFQLILFEGLSALDLGNYEEAQENAHRAHDYYQSASNKLNQIDQLSQTIIAPERIRIEIVNQRSLAAVKSGNLDEFETYLIEGAKGAKVLASEKRRQEAITNWKAARERWPHEQRVMELADVLF